MYYVYIMTNASHSVLYVGMTNDLHRRAAEHRTHRNPDSFTAKYRIHKLIWFEQTRNVYSAITREKQIKDWSREKKLKLILDANPTFTDLFPTL
ncbi:MAG: GIY-YIG nuclease family protein [Clostridia bacterium]|nr:GIY-YIG nuclease family protein [Clostridia bacterium]